MLRPTALFGFIETAVGGVLVGFVAAALGAWFLASPLFTGNRPPENVPARTFMSGLLRQDNNAVGQVRPEGGVASRAERIQSQATNGAQWRPSGLSYLGGMEFNGIGIYVYVAEVQPNDGSTAQIVPFTLTIQGGKVVRVQ